MPNKINQYMVSDMTVTVFIASHVFIFCSVPASNSRMKISRNWRVFWPMFDCDLWNRCEVKRSKVKVTRPHNAEAWYVNGWPYDVCGNTVITQLPLKFSPQCRTRQKQMECNLYNKMKPKFKSGLCAQMLSQARKLCFYPNNAANKIEKQHENGKATGYWKQGMKLDWHFYLHRVSIKFQ